MKIIKADDVDFVDKPEGTSVHYYTFSDYEIHYNEQAPHTTQTWHHHEKIWETLYIIEGNLTAKWRDGADEQTQLLHAGDLVQTERTPHTFSNDSDTVVKFVVFKHISSSEDFRVTLSTDKVLD
jgi:quercetin dioxygenase-like cupin family protein